MESGYLKMANNEDIYIEDRIAILEKQMQFILDNNFEDRISTLEDIVENDGHKLDELAERVSKTHGMVIHDDPQVQQTTYEFVRIVRCKECKWYANDIELYDRCRNEDGMFSPRDDDYCSEGEKRNEIN